MADHLRDELSKMLDQYDERRRGDLAREQKAKDDDALFLTRFAELRRSVVRPVFEAAGALLAERGHGFTISEQEFSVGEGNKPTEAGISFTIVPSGMESPLYADHARSLSLTTRHYNKTVWLSAGRPLDAGGVAGSKGAYPLERIDKQLIEEELVKFVAAIMAG
jgi:hypothetical protein